MVDPKETLEIMGKRRSVRKFMEDERIPLQILKRIVNSAHYAPFSCNLQPLSFLVVQSDSKRKKIFPAISWARRVQGYAPKNGEHPSAYTIPLADKVEVNGLIKKFYGRDSGKEAQKAKRSIDISIGIVIGFMVVQAELEGVSSCVLAGIDERAIKEALHIPEKFAIPSIIALGYARQKPKIVSIGPTEPTRYRISSGELIVPKRKQKVRWM